MKTKCHFLLESSWKPLMGHLYVEVFLCQIEHEMFKGCVYYIHASMFHMSMKALAKQEKMFFISL